MVAYFHAGNGDKVPLMPDKDERILSAEEIANSLAKQCRFNGHCRAFYSVARHSQIVACEVKRRAELAGMSKRSVRLLALAGLLHDSGEAVVGDIVSPIKRLLREDLSTLEKSHAQNFYRMATWPKKSITHPEIAGQHPLDHVLVKRVDLDAVVTEFIVFFDISKEQAMAYGGEPFIDDNTFKFESTWREDATNWLACLADLEGKVW